MSSLLAKQKKDIPTNGYKLIRMALESNYSLEAPPPELYM